MEHIPLSKGGDSVLLFRCKETLTDGDGTDFRKDGVYTQQQLSAVSGRCGFDAKDFELLRDPPHWGDLAPSIPALVKRCEKLSEWLQSPDAKLLRWRAFAGVPSAPPETTGKDILDPILRSAASLGMPLLPSMARALTREDASGWANRILEWARERRRQANQDAPARRRTGRPRKGETDKDTLIIGALLRHHQADGNSVLNADPATLKHLAALASDKKRGSSVSDASVSRFFKKKFGERGSRGYANACHSGAIGVMLCKWQGEPAPKRHAPLRDDD